MSFPSSRVVTVGDGIKQLVSFDKIQSKIVRQTVRSEEEYLDHLGTIIQRDFFPDLLSFDEENQKSSGFSTPSAGNFDGGGDLSHNPELDPTRMSLDKYLANNTTEDNASFIEVVEEADTKREAKLSQFFPLRKAPALTDGENQFLAITDNSSSSGRNELAQIPASQLHRSVDGLTSHNTVHFIPDGAPPTAYELTEHFNRERTICKENSRFRRPFLPTEKKKLLGPASIFKAGSFGIDGKERTSESPLVTPQAGGYRFMDASPSPLAADGTPLLTWGELESTPYRLDEASGRTPVVHSGLSSFHIPPTSPRETIAHQLADRAGQQRVRGRMEAMKKAKSGFVSPYSSKLLLSPAARRLLTSSGKLAFGGGVNLRPNSGLRKTDLLSESPRASPRRLPSDLGIIRRVGSSLTKPPRLSGKEVPAPSADDIPPVQTTSQTDESITNNLLNLPTVNRTCV